MSHLRRVVVGLMIIALSLLTITQRSERWRTSLGLPGAWVAGVTGR